MRIFVACVALLLSIAASAQQYNLVTEQSGVYFMTTKARHVTEGHSFEKISGTISGEQAKVSVVLSSWSTSVDIRDKRMTKHLLAGNEALMAAATVAIKTEWLAKGIGESFSYQTKVSFNVLGVQFERPLFVRVTALAGQEIQVTSIVPVVLSTNTLGVTEGIGQLQKLAGLSDISESVPVSFDLRFAKENK